MYTYLLFEVVEPVLQHRWQHHARRLFLRTLHDEAVFNDVINLLADRVDPVTSRDIQ